VAQALYSEDEHALLCSHEQSLWAAFEARAAPCDRQGRAAGRWPLRAGGGAAGQELVCHPRFTQSMLSAAAPEASLGQLRALLDHALRPGGVAPPAHTRRLAACRDLVRASPCPRAPALPPRARAPKALRAPSAAACSAAGSPAPLSRPGTHAVSPWRSAQLQRAVLAAEEAEDAAAPTRALVAQLDAARQRYLLAGSPRPLGAARSAQRARGRRATLQGCGLCIPWE